MQLVLVVGSMLLMCACGSVPQQPDATGEVCFDGVDNDGDGTADCADTSCDATARCVPSTAAAPAGIVVPESEPCPAGFEGGATLIHRGLQPGGCAGCGCTPGVTQCRATVWTYPDSNSCFNDVALNGGELIGFPITETCSPEPMTYGFIFGARTNIEIADQTCTPNGTGTPGASTWSETVKFCRASQTGTGCAAEHACVRLAPTADTQCALADAAGTCGDYASVETDWFTGVDDQRTCGACFCTATGGGCTGVVVEVGSDYGCLPFATVADDTRECFGQDYSPPARLVGASQPPTGCTADAPAAGMIAPSGQSTLCCAP
jgi:hypothetical protein